MTALRLQGIAATHPGLKRRLNEDSHCVRLEDGLVAVADGMGGHAHGDWASQAVIHALDSVVVPADFQAGVQAVADAIHSANRRIWAESQRREQQMGSTVAALIVHGDCFAAIWVGDSRAYLLRGGALVPLTRDHSQVQDMVDRGLITAEEARDHPRGHVLTRAIGVGARMQVDVVSDRAEPGDLFLLCSDGLTAVLDDTAIAGLLANGDTADSLDALIAATLAGGAPDNVTAILLGVQEATRLDLTGTSR